MLAVSSQALLCSCEEKKFILKRLTCLCVAKPSIFNKPTKMCMLAFTCCDTVDLKIFYTDFIMLQTEESCQQSLQVF